VVHCLLELRSRVRGGTLSLLDGDGVVVEFEFFFSQMREVFIGARSEVDDDGLFTNLFTFELIGEERIGLFGVVLATEFAEEESREGKEAESHAVLLLSFGRDGVGEFAVAADGVGSKFVEAGAKVALRDTAVEVELAAKKLPVREAKERVRAVDGSRSRIPLSSLDRVRLGVFELLVVIRVHFIRLDARKRDRFGGEFVSVLDVEDLPLALRFN
jgi:hypothetical protein